MIDNLERVLEASGQPALSELRAALARALGVAAEPVSCLEEHSFKSRVYRLRFQVRGSTRTVIAKLLEPDVASRCEQVVERWLPAEGLGHVAPRILAVAAATPAGIWHVYEDMGENSLQQDTSPERVEAAVRLIARLHTRYASHPQLDAYRTASEDLGISYFTKYVRGTIEALESLRGHEAMRADEHAALRDRLLARLVPLLESAPVRARSLAESGGAETLLHGDLWTTNVFVSRTATGLDAQLLDWDHAGVGPASYDLSTFLLRFPRERREGILDLYDRALQAEGGRPLERHGLALNFETAELARYANRAFWPARALARNGAAWGYWELARVESWFEAFAPVLDPPPAPPAPAPRRSSPRAEAEPRARYLIVNADDFGATPGVNRGILEAHTRGIVTSTSLMVEAPAAAEAAAASREVPRLGIGLHVDLGRDPSADGVDGIRAALARQAARFLELMGRKPTHLDSHRNAHLHPLALPEFLELSRRWGIPLRGHSRVRLLPSFYGQWHGESHPEQVGVESLLGMLASKVEPGITELICHPGYVEPALRSSYTIEREFECATLCHPEILRALAAHDIQLIGFHDLSRIPSE